MFGVLERLFVVRNEPHVLVLREYPLLAWLAVGALIIAALNMLLFGLHVTALGAIMIAALVILLARVRIVTFDRDADLFTVRLVALLRRSLPIERPLSDIQDVNVAEFESGHTQLVLTFHDGQEMGLSVFSKDIADWKTPLAEAIHAILP